MIDDIEARRRHWDDPMNRAPYADRHDLGDSLPYPFEAVEGMFSDRDVLEIGPGRGRQYERLRPAVKSYSICDISVAALGEPAFADAGHKFLLADYSDDFGHRFDVVHFWYVLHHVRSGELVEFLQFAGRHVRPDGCIMFNTPQVGNSTSWYTDDGMGTTWTDAKLVREALVSALGDRLVWIEVRVQDDRSSGALFLVRMSDGTRELPSSKTLP